MLSFKWTCPQFENLTGEQNEFIKHAIMIKNKREIENAYYQKKKPLVEYETVTDIVLWLTGSRCPIVFTEIAPEVEKNKIT